MADTFFFDHLNDRTNENILQQNILIKEDGEEFFFKYETGFQFLVNSNLKGSLLENDLVEILFHNDFDFIMSVLK